MGGASSQGVPLGLRLAWTPWSAIPLPAGDPVTPPTVLRAGAISGFWSVPGIDCPPVTGSALGKFQKAPGSNLSGQRGHQGWASASQKTPDPPVELARVPRAFPPSAQPASEDPGRSQPPCHTTGGPWWGPACDTQGGGHLLLHHCRPLRVAVWTGRASTPRNEERGLPVHPPRVRGGLPSRDGRGSLLCRGQLTAQPQARHLPS